MSTLILLNLKSIKHKKVIINHRVHYFHDLDLSYFYCIKAKLLITANHLQWVIYVKTKSCAHMCIKKLAQNFLGLLILHWVNRNI